MPGKSLSSLDFRHLLVTIAVETEYLPSCCASNEQFIELLAQTQNHDKETIRRFYIDSDKRKQCGQLLEEIDYDLLLNDKALNHSIMAFKTVRERFLFPNNNNNNNNSCINESNNSSDMYQPQFNETSSLPIATNNNNNVAIENSSDVTDNRNCNEKEVIKVIDKKVINNVLHYALVWYNQPDTKQWVPITSCSTYLEYIEKYELSQLNAAESSQTISSSCPLSSPRQLHRHRNRHYSHRQCRYVQCHQFNDQSQISSSLSLSSPSSLIHSRKQQQQQLFPLTITTTSTATKSRTNLLHDKTPTPSKSQSISSPVPPPSQLLWALISPSKFKQIQYQNQTQTKRTGQVSSLTNISHCDKDAHKNGTIMNSNERERKIKDRKSGNEN
jgi:hypothetical protein